MGGVEQAKVFLSYRAEECGASEGFFLPMEKRRPLCGPQVMSFQNTVAGEFFLYII